MWRRAAIETAVTENQISQDVAEQQGNSEAEWRHVLRLRASSEHLIEFSLNKILAIFIFFFSPTHWELSRGLYACLVQERWEESDRVGRRLKKKVKVGGRGALGGDKRS